MLRTLARQANINVVVEESITGIVALRLEDKTPREALEIIAQAKDLVLDERKGVMYVRPRVPPPPKPEKPWDQAFGEMFAPTLAKMYDSLLDYEARPETARKMARAKKAFYDALVAEGFTKDEALRIILTNQELPFYNANK